MNFILLNYLYNSEFTITISNRWIIPSDYWRIFNIIHVVDEMKKALWLDQDYVRILGPGWNYP
jgi:hypothetical protein